MKNQNLWDTLRRMGYYLTTTQVEHMLAAVKLDEQPQPMQPEAEWLPVYGDEVEVSANNTDWYRHQTYIGYDPYNKWYVTVGEPNSRAPKVQMCSNYIREPQPRNHLRKKLIKEINRLTHDAEKIVDEILLPIINRHRPAPPESKK